MVAVVAVVVAVDEAKAEKGGVEAGAVAGGAVAVVTGEGGAVGLGGAVTGGSGEEARAEEALRIKGV